MGIKRDDVDTGTNDDSTVYAEALAETRRVVDVQVEMVENTDTEIISLMRLNLLAFGGLVTLVAYVPNLIASALPWVVISVPLFVLSVLLSVFIYRGVTLYAGFGDHGYDAYVPKQKVRYDSIINPSVDGSSDREFVRPDRPSTEAFRAALLNEHQSGISHNNVEIKYRSQIHQQVILLFLTAILVLGIGLVVAIADISGAPGTAVVVLATGGAVAAALYTIVKSAGLISRFIRTKADPNRLSYGYAFERQYPHLNRVCSFVTAYLYDPSDDDW
jgi:FtsH-binding integral membrane protein